MGVPQGFCAGGLRTEDTVNLKLGIEIGGYRAVTKDCPIFVPHRFPVRPAGGGTVLGWEKSDGV